MGLFRRGSDDTLRLIERNPTTDPSAVAKHVLVYGKDVAGVTQLFARASDGTVSQLTPGATISPVADNGNRSQIRRGGADVLRFIEIAADPAAVPGKILAYGKNVGGVTQLFTRDDSGAIVQITPHLTATPSGGAASSEVRRDGSEILSIIGRTDDATAIANSDLLYGKIVGSFVQLFARLSDGTVALISEGPLDVTGVTPNQVYRISETGSPVWDGNFPLPQNVQYWEYENGGAGAGGQGLNAWQNGPVGAGAARTPLTGEAGWFPNAASFETGTTPTGAYSTGRQASVVFDTTTGLWSHEGTYSIPVLSDNTDSFYFGTGFVDLTFNPTLAVNNAYVMYTHSINGGRFQLITAKNSIRSTVDTGVTVVAGTYYHIRVTVTNAGLVSCWIKTTFSGTTWSDDSNWGAPTVTLSTNIPSGTGQPVFASYGILKYAGTNSRLFKAGFQLLYHDPAFTPSGNIVAGTGLQAGNAETGIAVDGTAQPSWLAPLRNQEPIQFYAYARGGWIPSASADFGPEQGGTGGNGSATVQALDNNLWGSTNLNTSTPTDGYCFYRTSYSLNLDSYTNPMVVETVLEVPTLSSVAQQFKVTFGLFDQVASTLTRGITIELDSVVNANFQCVVTGPSGTTTVNSGLAAVAGNQYLCRLIITSTSVDFYIVRNGVTALTTPIATIATNIPTVTPALAAGMGIRKLAGATSRNARYGHLLAYQRSA